MYKQIFILLLSFFLFLTTVHASELEDEIRVGYYLDSLTDVDKKDIEISLKLWTKELQDFTGTKISTTFYYAVKKLKEDFDQKKIDLLVASPLIIVKHFDIDQLKDGFASGTELNNKNTTLHLLVRKDTNIKTLKELKNRRVALLKNADMDELFLNSELLNNGLQESDHFFKKAVYIKKRSQAILKLFFKKVDAALVTESAFDLASELNPQIKQQITSIAKIGAYTQSTGLFRKDFDQKKVDSLTNAALRIHTQKRGKQILTLFKSSKIVKSHIEDIKRIEKIYQQYLALKQ